jgi:TonB family protein
MKKKLQKKLNYFIIRPQLGWSVVSFFTLLIILVSVRWSDSDAGYDSRDFEEFNMVELKIRSEKPASAVVPSDETVQRLTEELPEEPLSFGSDSDDFGDPAEGARPPRPLFSKLPAYPDSMRKARVEGIVMIEIGIDEKGRVVFGRVVQSLGREFDKAVIEWARAIKFYPAMSPDREPLKCRIRLPVRFKLEG